MKNRLATEATISTIKNSIVFISIALGIYIFFESIWYLQTKNKYLNELKKETACPSMLSIARSARDTLIIMKAEPLCINFVLENLE
jgi:hypothetical protein